MTNGEPFFSPYDLPDPKYEKVVWIDIMGTTAQMDWSPAVATTNIAKLHLAVAQSNAVEQLDLYPMMDGVYITGNPSDNSLGRVLTNAYEIFSKVIVNRHSGTDSADLKFSPIIRAGVAEGKIYHGSDFDDSGLEYIDDLVFGKPISKAHLSEANAPPFGIHVHQAMNHNDAGTNIEWWNTNHGKKVHKAVDRCLEIHANNPRIDYSQETFEKHRQEIREYFPPYE